VASFLVLMAIVGCWRFSWSSAAHAAGSDGGSLSI
jgi:hypothetical protein